MLCFGLLAAPLPLNDEIQPEQKGQNNFYQYGGT